jgi:integrase/recombinase XerD
MKTFSSVLATTIRDYLMLKRALGRLYNGEEWVLSRLDQFLSERNAELTQEIFAAWCLTLQKLASGVRRAHMRSARNLCLFRRRREPGCFVPDERLFPPLHQKIRPHIFTDAQVAQLLALARTLTRTANSPLCPENMRLAIVLFYTTGLRRGELARLTVGDYNRQERLLVIRASKFHKSRLLPLSVDAVREIDRLLEIRRGRRFPVSSESPLLWHKSRSYTGQAIGETMRMLFSRAGIRTSTGHLPRTHDFRQNAEFRKMPNHTLESAGSDWNGST